MDNRDGELMPGALAQVHFKTPPVGPTFIVPAAALIFRREGLQVGTRANGATEPWPIWCPWNRRGRRRHRADRQRPERGDQVIQDPPDSLIDGEKVTVENAAERRASEGGQ